MTHLPMSRLLLAAALAGAALGAQAQVRLGAYAIPGVFEADKSGDYDKLLARLAAAGGPKLDYTTAPPARLEDDFKAGKLDCVIPLDARFWEAGKFFNTEPLNVAKIYIFSKAGEGPYTAAEQLKGKKVGARRGMPYGPKFDAAGLNPELVTEDGQNVQKLAAGRLDAFVAYVPDMWQWAADKKQPLPNHDKARPMDTHKDAFLCRDTPAARDFAKAFDAAVTKLRASGELQKILGASYVP